jgi:hypothetical protein
MKNGRSMQNTIDRKRFSKNTFFDERPYDEKKLHNML